MRYTFILVMLMLLAACGNHSKTATSGITLTGAGATFPQPYYDVAFKQFQDSTHINVIYGGIGSGGGIRSLKDRVVDFGATDAFLSDKELASMPAAVVHIPTCIGAVILAYNLPGVDSLKLTAEILADIYLGKIKKWNDPRLKAINGTVNLPGIDIYPVYRSDGSGTTFVFSDYLSKVSPQFYEVVGCGKSLKWPTGIASKGNPGAAGTISQTLGSIGYISSEYAFAQHMPAARLKNSEGTFITPTLETISAAAAGDFPPDTRAMLTNSSNPLAYPISCMTWILVYKEQYYNNRSRAQADATVDLLSWLTDSIAQQTTTQVHYSPLPPSVISHAKEIISAITYKGQPIIK